jgi:short/branched chain acyl-CoA dehydrogenase
MMRAAPSPYLTDEHERLRATVRDFATTQVEPHAGEWDRANALPVEIVHAMGELGLFAIPFAPPYGAGGDLLSLCVAVEELGRVDQSVAITLDASVGLGAAPIYKFGSPEQKDRWLPDLCAGRALGAFGLTEPDGGSDAGALRTRAQLDDGEWVINGEKAFITNSGTPITSIVTVAARTAPQEISAIVVPSGTSGLVVQPAYRKLGWHASDTHGLTFDECRVPEDHLLGELGRGMPQFLEILDEGRVTLAALAVGVIQRCVDDSSRYARDRRAFGHPIADFQGVAFQCADMDVSLAAARHLTYHAAWLRDQGHPYTEEAAIAKLFATEAAVGATRHAVQVFGGSGFVEDNALARHYRDAKVLEIGEGTSEIQRVVISRALGL